MEGFTVKCSVLKHSKLEMDRLEHTMKNCSQDIGRIRRNLRGKISAEEQIGTRLEKLEERLEIHAKDLIEFGKLAYFVAERYLLAEKIILGKKESWKELDGRGLVSDIVGEFGVVGSAIKLDILDSIVKRGEFGESEPVKWWWWCGCNMQEFEKEDTVLKSFLKGAKEEAGENIVNEIKNWGRESELLNHLDRNLRTAYENALQHGEDTTFIKELFRNTKDAAVDSWSYKSLKDLSKACGIIGTVGSVWSVGQDNYEEYRQGEISGGRAFFETFGELSVDWALDIGLTAAALAVLPAGAPAVAVGAAVVGAGWLLDEVTQWVTKDADASFTEVTSDAVLDFAASSINTVCDWWGRF